LQTVLTFSNFREFLHSKIFVFIFFDTRSQCALAQ